MNYSLIILFALTAVVQADDALQQRVAVLEKRIARLEEKLAPVLEEERVKAVVRQQREVARERMLLDAEIFNRHDLNRIEKLYHAASRDWTSEEAAKAVAFLSEKYAKANRTGCAALSRAQATNGDEQLALLKQAIEGYGGCFYPNGVQVGPYARLYLAMRHKRDGEDAAAARLFQEIRAAYPDAVDHKGQLLLSHLKDME